MKLVDLLLNQNVIVQLTWGVQKIEFSSNVIDKGDGFVYVTPYMHNGSELQLNVAGGSVVVCNVFADDSVTGQRISWRNVELSTENKNNRILYCIKTHGFNNVANPDDRRHNERTIIQIDGIATDVHNDEAENITVRDISGVGVAFYAPASYAPKTQNVVVTFSDVIDDKTFDVKVECVISRMNIEDGRALVGCRLLGENRDFQLYRFIKYLKSKNGNKMNSPEHDNQIISPSDEDAAITTQSVDEDNVDDKS